ncbi:hypothetical protein BJV78DRAFT_424457 [Lactifluus subvellereus]|nr:hypothetical protein BJV78DRAFT_424457 [Lactifluus subvellereus]
MSKRFSGARVGEDQKTQFLNELLDAALEQFLAELGNAIMDFIDGPHCTIVDPRQHGDPQALQAKARSLVARFEKLGRDRGKVLVAISATETGIDAATCLQREDGINVNLTSVSGVTHATACAQAGAAAVTLPIASMRDWRRGRTGNVVADPEGNSGTEREEDAETIAAYFELHGISSTALIASTMDHVDDACPLAALAAMSFDADQARKAEWYDTYPNVPRTLPERAMRRARAFPPPREHSKSDAGVGTGAFGLLRNLDEKEFSKFSAIVHTAVGSDQAVMTAIASIVQREIDWQLSLLQPMFIVPKRLTEMCAGTGTGTGTGTTITAAAVATGATQIQHNLRPRKRKRSLVRAPGSPGSPTPPERKRSKVTAAGSREYGHRATPVRSSTPGPQDEPGGKTAPAESAGLRERLGGDTPPHRTTMTTRSGAARGGRGGAARVAGSSYVLRPRHQRVA